MGYKYYIYVWDICPVDERYYYCEVYGGQSFVKAMFAFVSARFQGFASIKWEWRP
jgi:hypothetical protein